MNKELNVKNAIRNINLKIEGDVFNRKIHFCGRLLMLLLLILVGNLWSDENDSDELFMEDGYYHVVESVVQIPSLSFKAKFNQLCYIKRWESDNGRYGYSVKPIEGNQRSIDFYENGSIKYNGSYYLTEVISHVSRFDFNAGFDYKKGNIFVFTEINLFNGDVTRRVVLTYLGKDLKQAVKKLK